MKCIPIIYNPNIMLPKNFNRTALSRQDPKIPLLHLIIIVGIITVVGGSVLLIYRWQRQRKKRRTD